MIRSICFVCCSDSAASAGRRPGCVRFGVSSWLCRRCCMNVCVGLPLGIGLLAVGNWLTARVYLAHGNQPDTILLHCHDVEDGN